METIKKMKMALESSAYWYKRSIEMEIEHVEMPPGKNSRPMTDDEKLRSLMLHESRRILREFEGYAEDKYLFSVANETLIDFVANQANIEPEILEKMKLSNIIRNDSWVNYEMLFDNLKPESYFKALCSLFKRGNK